MTSYFERHGAKPCNTDENPAEWMLETTGSIADSDDPQNWSEIWDNSQECKAMKSKLVHLKEKFSERLKPENVLSTSDAPQQPAVGLDSMALQRERELFFFFGVTLSMSNTSLGTFCKYLFLENMELPSDSPKSDICRCCLTNHASVHRPIHLP